MDENLSKVMDIGCIVYQRKHCTFTYNFLSLLNLQQRTSVHKLVKNTKTRHHIINIDFDNLPIFSPLHKNDIYFINR